MDVGCHGHICRVRSGTDGSRYSQMSVKIYKLSSLTEAEVAMRVEITARTKKSSRADLSVMLSWVRSRAEAVEAATQYHRKSGGVPTRRDGVLLP